MKLHLLLVLIMLWRNERKVITTNYNLSLLCTKVAINAADESYVRILVYLIFYILINITIYCDNVELASSIE